MAMIYLLDGNQEVIKIVRSSAVISVIQTQELPEDNSLLRDYLSVRLKNDERLFNAQYMAVKSYGGNRNAFDLYRIASEMVPDNATEFMGVQVAPYELEGVVIEDLRPQNRPLNQTMNQVLEGSDWRLGYVSDNLPNVTTNFYYTSVKDALKKIQELTNVEMLFKVEITGNKITDKWVEVYHQLGNRTMKRFNYGTNALSVVRESSHDELYTALIGRGKGEEVGETESGDATYGRKINFADVEWKKSAGNPVDKPKGQKYIELPNATAEYGIKLLDGRKVPRIGIVEFSDTDDPEKLIQETYQELLVRARPKVLFKASVINTGDMLIGDTVTIHRHDLGFHYQARVRKVVRDRKNNNQTQVEIGDVVHTPSTKRQGQINSALNNVASDLDNVRGEITEARQSADGKNTNFYGNVEPDRKKVGDTWFRDHPSITGESQILVWNGEAWELIMDTSDTTKVAEDVLEAKGIAETARDNALNIATDLLEGTSFYKHTQNIGLASKNSDGTVNSIINLGSDGTAYIGGRNIVLDGNTIVDGTFTITDKMIAPNAEIDGAKIADATIGSAKIANLDAAKITTGSINAGNNSSWDLTTGVLQTTGDWAQLRIRDGSLGFYRKDTGRYLGGLEIQHFTSTDITSLSLITGNPNDRSLRFIGTRIESTQRDLGQATSSIHLIPSGDGRVRTTTEDSAYWYGLSTSGVEFQYGSELSENTDGVLSIQGNSQLLLRQGGGTYAVSINASRARIQRPVEITGNLTMNNNARIRFLGADGATAREDFFRGTDDWLSLNASGVGRTKIHGSTEANIVGTSDIRLKTRVNDSEMDALDLISKIRFIEFDWDLSNKRNVNQPEGRQYGLEAQSIEFLQVEDEFGYLSVDQNKEVILNSQAIQQLNRKVESSNSINEEKIHQLQQELSKANRRIEELEGAI